MASISKFPETYVRYIEKGKVAVVTESQYETLSEEVRAQHTDVVKQSFLFPTLEQESALTDIISDEKLRLTFLNKALRLAATQICYKQLKRSQKTAEGKSFLFEPVDGSIDLTEEIGKEPERVRRTPEDKIKQLLATIPASQREAFMSALIAQLTENSANDNDEVDEEDED